MSSILIDDNDFEFTKTTVSAEAKWACLDELKEGKKSYETQVELHQNFRCFNHKNVKNNYYLSPLLRKEYTLIIV